MFAVSIEETLFFRFFKNLKIYKFFDLTFTYLELAKVQAMQSLKMQKLKDIEVLSRDVY